VSWESRLATRLPPRRSSREELPFPRELRPSGRFAAMVIGLWLLVLSACASLLAYVLVIDPSLMFLFVMLAGMFAYVSVPIALLILFGPPIWAFVTSLRWLARRRYWYSAAFAVVPVVGVGWSLLSLSIAEYAFTARLLATYRAEIAAARTAGESVSGRMTTISLGPPIHARFIQPTMFWHIQQIVYDETDQLEADRTLAKDCSRFWKSLGGHFYRVNGEC
jgi:hypothetical protein